MEKVIRPNFACTVCHLNFLMLDSFKEHLESADHEVAYGLKLKTAMVCSLLANIITDLIIIVIFVKFLPSITIVLASRTPCAH